MAADVLYVWHIISRNFHALHLRGIIELTAAVGRPFVVCAREMGIHLVTLLRVHLLSVLHQLTMACYPSAEGWRKPCPKLCGYGRHGAQLSPSYEGEYRSSPHTPKLDRVFEVARASVNPPVEVTGYPRRPWRNRETPWSRSTTTRHHVG